MAPQSSDDPANLPLDDTDCGRRPSGGLPDGLACGRRPSGGLPDALDALVLLGCRVAPASRSGAAHRRALRAASAYAAGVAPLVVVSGGKRWHGVREADALRESLLRAGVPDSAIVVETRSLTTRQNARFVAELLRRRGFTRAGIVTCDWHLPRAIACFSHFGIDAVRVPVPSPPLPPIRRLRRQLRESTSSLLGRALDRLAALFATPHGARE